MRLDDHRALNATLIALRYDLACFRFAMLERKYRTDQPRVPAGSPDGGEWTSDGGYFTDAAYRRNPVGPIDLKSGEGGHAIKRHVDQSNSALKAAIAERDNRTGTQDIFSLKPQGSFDSWESANKYTNDVLASNEAKVNDVISGKYGDGDVFISKRYDSPTGREAYTSMVLFDVPIRQIQSTFSVGVVIHRVNSPRGYQVTTAYPMNSDPSGD